MRESLKLKDWLQAVGLKEDPFQDRRAEEEDTRHLHECFVEPNSFGDILGEATNPKSSVLFAPQGGGKSANRMMVDRWCKIGERVGGRVFVIRYTRDELRDVHERARGTAIEGHHHVDEILRTATLDVFHYVLSHPEVYGVIDPLIRQFLHWLGRTYIYPDDERLKQILNKRDLLEIVNCAKLRDALDSRLKREDIVANLPANKKLVFEVLCDTLTGEVPEIRVTKETPSDMMGRFSKLATAIGMTATYVLVDGIDEFPPLATNPSLGGGFLRSLLCDLMLLETSKVAFKFFLPSMLEPSVRSYLREDRINVYALVWTERQLLEMLQRRLSAFSEGRLSSLAAISQSDVRNTIDDEIVRRAEGLPRNLMRLGAHLFRVHVHNARADDEQLLTKTDLEEGYRAFEAERRSSVNPSGSA